MPPEQHALLSASASHRWLHCPPSARLCENYEDQSSVFAAEGSDAHALCEYRLLTALGIEAENPIENLTWYNAEMEDCAAGYVSFVMEQVEAAKRECKDPTVLVEQRLDFSDYVPGGFGTGDCLIVSDGTLHIIDYKHGRGVLVEADHNPQMMLYALGALALFDYLYYIDTVSMTIYQPRKGNVSTYTIPKQELLDWAEYELKPAAQKAWNGEGEYACGDWCQFCKAKQDCRERARANLEMLRYDFRDPPLLSDDEIEDVLAKADELISWATDVKDYAFKAALDGKHWRAFKLVEGRSIRRYTDEAAVAVVAENAGYTDIYKKTLIPITEMEKAMGKKTFTELLGSFVIKPQGKPTLVPRSDKRPEMNTTDVKEDFDNEQN